MTGALYLTDPILRAAPAAPPGTRIEMIDAGCPGLRVRVDERGRKVFSVMRVIGAGSDKGKRVRVTLRPDYPALTLKEARKQALALLGRLGAGENPNSTHRATERASRNTFAEQWELYQTLKLSQLRPRSVKEVERPFRVTFLPEWRDRHVDTITRAEIADVLDRLQLDRGLVPRNRAQAALSTFFAWLVDRGRIGASPVAGMKRAPGEAPRDRVLSDAEIRAFWKATAADAVWRPATDDGDEPSRAHPVFAPLLRVLLLTGQRLSEVAGMRRDEIIRVDKVVTWKIPAERYKTKRPHEVPLSGAVLQIIDARPHLDMVERRPGGDVMKPSPFLFTTRGDAPFSGDAKLKPELDAAMLAALKVEATERKEPADRVQLPRWTIHDLRRTARTLLQRAGVPYDVGEAVLGHVVGGGGVGAVYARHGFADEKRAALDKLAELIGAIAAPTGGNVTELAVARAKRR